MDKLEYHTVQAVQKLDPYALLKMWSDESVQENIYETKCGRVCQLA